MAAAFGKKRKAAAVGAAEAVKIVRDDAESLEVVLSIGSEEMEAARQEALVALSSDLKVAGFRAGKVPAGVAEKHLDPSKMLEKQLDIAVKTASTSFLRAQDGKFIGIPQVEVTKFVPGEMAEWTLKVDKFPTIKLADYKKLKVKKPAEGQPLSTDEVVETLVAASKVPVPESMVMAHVQQMLQQIAQDLQFQQKTMADFIAQEGVATEAELIEQKIKPAALKQAQFGLVLNALADQLQITVSDEELEKQLTQLKQHYGSAEIAGVLDEPRVQEDIRGRLRIDKVVGELMQPYLHLAPKPTAKTEETKAEKPASATKTAKTSPKASKTKQK